MFWKDAIETCTQVVNHVCRLMQDWYVANTTILTSSHNNISTNSVHNDQTRETTFVKQGDSGITLNSSTTITSGFGQVVAFESIE